MPNNVLEKQTKETTTWSNNSREQLELSYFLKSQSALLGAEPEVQKQTVLQTLRSKTELKGDSGQQQTAEALGS